MKLPIAILATLAATPALSANLPGVADHESHISSLPLSAVEQGNGDVVFVRDNGNRWYRVALNDGCLRNASRIDRVVVDHRLGGQPLRRNAAIGLAVDGMNRTCLVNSVRRSAAPPQIDSKSPVTLD